MVAGPILLIYALTHGRSFTSQAACDALLGLISLAVFVVVYGRMAGRASWWACLLTGWLGFALATTLFSALSLSAAESLALACAGLFISAVLLPDPEVDLASVDAPPTWDLPLRAGCALLLVLTLTALAGQLGAQLSGLLAPFPVIASVLTVFTHSQRGVNELRRLVRGLIIGLGAFALFCFTISVSVRGLGIAGGFLLASAVAITWQAVVLWSVGDASAEAILSAGSSE